MKVYRVEDSFGNGPSMGNGKSPEVDHITYAIDFHAPSSYDLRWWKVRGNPDWRFAFVCEEDVKKNLRIHYSYIGGPTNIPVSVYEVEDYGDVFLLMDGCGNSRQFVFRRPNAKLVERKTIYLN